MDHRRTLWRKDTFCKIIKDFEVLGASFTFACNLILPRTIAHQSLAEYTAGLSKIGLPLEKDVRLKSFLFGDG